MNTVKEQVRAVLDRMPDDCSFEDLQYELYVLEKIRQGEESLRIDGGISHEEAKKRMAKWLAK